MPSVDFSTYISPEFNPLVLVVDDDVTSALMLSKVLERDGYRIQTVHNGQAALEQFQTELPDIILMDAIMPGMDGFECTKLCRARYGNHCPPILMITGLNDSESVDYAFEVGATDYVTKPFHWAVLRQRVRRTIKAYVDYRNLQDALQKERSLRQELRLTNQKLHRLATVDGLTNIANRRVFDERFQHEWKRLQREQAPLGLALFDIDCFKAYNDTYGHQGGDNCLRDVAQVIQQVARRPADLAARYGGEEFALVLPNTDLEGTVHLANLVQHRLQHLAIPHASSIVRSQVTVSVGVASTVPDLSISAHLLLRTADLALYEAKQQGRDRVVAYATLDQGLATLEMGDEQTTEITALSDDDLKRYDEATVQIKKATTA
ncbi:MAG: diguanylate cyclase [Leptolyngbyaceae cyanobacterium]